MQVQRGISHETDTSCHTFVIQDRALGHIQYLSGFIAQHTKADSSNMLCKSIDYDINTNPLFATLGVVCGGPFAAAGKHRFGGCGRGG